VGYVHKERKDPMTTAQSLQDNRLLAFANVFKGYMGVMPIVTAALAPVITVMNVIPTYKVQREPLAAMAGMLGFLLLSWLFYVRRTIALGSITPGPRALFNVLPFFLIVCSVVCYVAYANTLDASLAVLNGGHAGVPRIQALSSGGEIYSVPLSARLQLLYLGMFLCPEAAFVMMALREYINGVRKISEREWMFGAQPGSVPPGIPAAGVDSVTAVTVPGPFGSEGSSRAQMVAGKDDT
jgi:hypothetical protein